MSKQLTKDQKLEIIRHSLSHVMAAAMLDMFPEVKLGIGPAIENGFYYDFNPPRTLIPEDLVIIENKMKEIIKANYAFEKKDISTREAVEHFEKLGQSYKVELIKDLEKEGNEKVSIYKSGPLVDLCAGPHMESTGELPIDGFKLQKISGAYWKGDEKNAQMQRIYGVAFSNKKELKEYLHMMEEAEKRDNRKLGKEMDLYMMHEIAPGMPFFLPKGMAMLIELITFVREESYGEGYREVRTPQLLNSELWKISGHWDHYQEDMFCLHHAEDNIDIGVKPMNCPAHMLVFKRDVHSYRELPLRIAETTTLYRNERSGTLQGLTRVRSLSQDDTHIFAREDQIMEEILTLLEKIKRIYTIFNLDIDEIHLSTRPESFLGEKETWDFAEDNLKQALQKAKLNYKINEGDGAFYGPKIDVKVKDAIGRQWQLATIQLDFQMPRRFELSYIDADGKEKTPIVIHRALLGSMERFLGIIIEHFAGAFPTWLAPVQVAVLPVSEKFAAYGEKVVEMLKAQNIRVELHNQDESLGKRIRTAEKQKIPYMLVVGEKEAADGTVAVRKRGNKEQEVITVEDYIKAVLKEIKDRK